MSGVGLIRVVLSGPATSGLPRRSVSSQDRIEKMVRYAVGDRQLPHARHAQTARRANLPHASALAASGKSEAFSRPSRLDEEGRTRGRHDT